MIKFLIFIFFFILLTACQEGGNNYHRLYFAIEHGCQKHRLERYIDTPLEDILPKHSLTHPLSVAVVVGDFECVKNVHELYGGINHRSSKSRDFHTPLFNAVLAGSGSRIEQYLIDNGADQTLKDRRGNTVEDYRKRIAKMKAEGKLKN